jgi:phospholipid N-methyltransferase
MSKLAEFGAFFQEFRRTYRTTGAVLPSSRFVARRLAAPLDRLASPARILEAGPGTGAVTHTLLKRLRPADHLTVVELNERFVDVLERRFASDPTWAAKREQTTIVHGAVEDLPDARYDAIVCGLPFNNFEPALVDRLLGKLLTHLTPGAMLSFFEYLAIRQLKAPFAGRRERARLRAVADVLGDYARRYRVGRKRVVLNVPPAVVHYLQAPC